MLNYPHAKLQNLTNLKNVLPLLVVASATPLSFKFHPLAQRQQPLQVKAFDSRSEMPGHEQNCLWGLHSLLCLLALTGHMKKGKICELE